MVDSTSDRSNEVNGIGLVISTVSVLPGYLSQGILRKGPAGALNLSLGQRQTTWGTRKSHCAGHTQTS